MLTNEGYLRKSFFLYIIKFKEVLYEETIKFIKIDGLCGEAQNPDLSFLDFVAASALIALVPFYYIWRIVHDILETEPGSLQAQKLTGYGWQAVGFAVLSVIIYIGALMCSHLSAFRIASNIRKELMRHITALPLGVAERYGSGKLRRIVNDSSAATETYLAHRLPDKAGAIATPVGLLVLLLAFDWRWGF